MSRESPIRISQEAKQAVAKEANGRNMEQKIVASKVLLWFGRQNWEVKSLILGHDLPLATRTRLLGCLNQ